MVMTHLHQYYFPTEMKEAKILMLSSYLITLSPH